MRNFLTVKYFIFCFVRVQILAQRPTALLSEKERGKQNKCEKVKIMKLYMGKEINYHG